jgi:hypothetical protein
MTDDSREPIEAAWEEVNPRPENPSLEEMEEEATLIHLDRFPKEQVVGGGLIIQGSPKQEELPDLNKLPVRTELTVLPADEVRQPIGLRFYERTPEELAERDSPENLAALRTQREATDVADSYISSHGVDYETRDHSFGWFSLPVLQELWGTPWNNAATNFLRCLRPSAVRVTTGNVTLDSMPWRVTVLLNGNRRTIQSIHQEVEVALNGFRNGSDAGSYILGRSRELESPQPQAAVNLRWVRNLSIHGEEYR